MVRVSLFDDLPMVGEAWHLLDGTGLPRMPVRHVRPIRLEAELAVAPGKAVDVMRGGEIGLAIDPALRLQPLDAAPAGTAQRPVDQPAAAHLEPRVTRVEPPRQCADDLVVGAAFAGRLDQLGPELDVLVAAALVEVVVLE